MPATKLAAETTHVLGIDWDSHTRRAYLLDPQGKLLRSHADAQGTLVSAPNFAPVLAALLDHLHMARGRVIMSGAIGGQGGWRATPYQSTDLPLAALPQLLEGVDSPAPDISCQIVPGFCFDDAFGVPALLRGEETRIFGARLLGAPDGWFLLPGLHSKWVAIEHGMITAVANFMSGEFADLMTRHSTLAPLMLHAQPSSQAFEDGLRAAGHSGLSAAVLGCGALAETGRLADRHAASYLSGLLIGAEVADIRRRSAKAQVRITQVIGLPEQTTAYVRALSFFDMRSMLWPADAVYVAALFELAGL